ncbi:zinc finger protein 28-like [Macrobrachium nipponense]|uniref:zinc finger protein 28-like n=1 Tax=Macrobrachium nipponense TaxID=159736 RepID=UPI0030C85A94
MSELHNNPKADVMASGAKIPVSAIPGIGQQNEASNIPILMNVDDMYEENLSDTEECFVLVDDRSVRVMSGSSSVQQLLSSQEPSIGVGAEKTVQVMQMDGSKALELMSDKNRETIEVVQMNDASTVEVLPMEDGKTVEVVQMDAGDKTLEVMHVDAVKHSEVIHVDGSSSIELLSVGASLKGPSLTSASPTVYQKNKEKYIFSSHGCETSTTSFSGKRQTMSESVPSSAALSLNSLTHVNSSFVLTTPKNSLLSGHQFSHMPSITTLVSSRQSQVLENDLESITQVTPSIILSNKSKGMASNVDGLDNTIIISWPTVSSKVDNSVETQTEPYSGSGPSLNLFLCTFHQDGSAETQCDMPVQRSISVSTNGGGGSFVTKILNNSTGGGGIQGVKLEKKEAESLHSGMKLSRNGQPFKLKESLYKTSADFLCKPEDYNFDLEGNEDQNCNYDNITTVRKKRGRKKKKRYPSNDDYDYDMVFENNCSEEINENKTDTLEENEICIKEEPVDNEDEMALNILKTKGYGLRTKRRIKKLSDMHYMEEKVVKKKTERTQHFSCQWCSDVFPTFTKLQRHAKEEHDSTDFAFPCDLCGVVFTRPHNLERHKDTKHGDGEKRFACEHCGRRFGRQDVLSVHISMVHFKKSLQGKSATSVFDPNTFHCTGCDQFFSKEQKLKNHRQGDLSCSDCKLTFECKASLRAHQYKHHPTSCSECGKLCDSKQQMYLHRMSHDPKYVCDICQKGFLWKSQFAVHMSTHTGEKTVSCNICGKSFAHRLAVNKHKWQEHDESNKKFKCQTCGKCFVYKGKLQAHMRSHTGEKPFICHLCSASFSQRCNLTAHIRSVHGVYIQSIKSDGTTQTQLVKYKRVKKQPPLEAQSTVVNAVMTHSVETSVPEQPQIAIQEQVQMSDSFETEAAVYQIVYAYQQ